MKRYEYKGAVRRFNTIVINEWQGYTVAETKAKAKSNFLYRIKKELGLTATAKIELCGEVSES